MSPIRWFQLAGCWMARRQARLPRAFGVRWLFLWSVFGVKEARRQRGATSAPSHRAEHASQRPGAPVTRAAREMALNTSRPVRSLGIWFTFLSHWLARLARPVLRAPCESIDDELRRVEREFEDERSMRHAHRLIAEAIGIE